MCVCIWSSLQNYNQLNTTIKQKITVKTDSIVGSLAEQLKDWMDCGAN